MVVLRTDPVRVSVMVTDSPAAGVPSGAVTVPRTAVEISCAFDATEKPRSTMARVAASPPCKSLLKLNDKCRNVLFMV